MRCFGPVLLLALVRTLQAAGPTPPPSAYEIMRRVAANEDCAQAERSKFIYEQNIRVDTRRTNGKLMREERQQLLVLPTPKGVQKKLVSFNGRYWRKGRYVDFQGEPVPESDGFDGSLVSSFRDDVAKDTSKDGMNESHFPLTTKEQQNYRFQLLGEVNAGGRKAWRIKFDPVSPENLFWTGEALIDEEEFEPVRIYTRLSRPLPMFVRTLLGTNVPGLGFNIQYARIEKGIWFPVSYGTEFRLRAVFFLKRNISASVQNSNFKRATSESTIEYGPLPLQVAR